MQRRLLLASITTSLATGIAPLALGQAVWPDRPVRIVVPDAPGSGNDITARIFAHHLERGLRQGFPVDNRVGAGGRIGVEAVFRAAPDGATLLLGNAGSNGINAALYRDLPYNLETDFTPISLLVVGPNALGINPRVLPVADVAALLALLRARPPGSVNYASAGPGSSSHFSAELFQAMAGVRLTHIPYRGAAQMGQAVVSGDAPLVIGNLVNLQGFADRGEMRLLAVTSRGRWEGTPDIPTLHESGLPGFETLAWNGFFGPPGLPGAVAARLLPELRRIAALPDVQERIASIGGRLVTSDGPALAARVRDDIAKWRALAASANIRAE